MASVQRFSAKVIAVRQLTHDVRQIDFRLIEPREIRFKAGQFVSFEVPDARTGRTVTRPYSIASAPSTPDRVSLLLNFVPDGPGSTYLFKLNEGDTTTFSGPAGNFYLRDDPERELLFLATGTGIAPEITDQLFQPFITTKPQGMGVGLSISRTIIEAHGGQITVLPNPGGGTVFCFTLRVVTKEDLGDAW